MRKIAAFAILASGALAATGADAQVDRYGGSAERRPTRLATAAPWQARTASEPGRTLSWPGKSAAAPAREEAAPPAAAEPTYPAARVAAPAARPQAPQPATLPTSIYETPQPQPVAAAPAAPPATPPVQTARRADGPRFYSVHRDFGIAPDAAPIPPQFFTETADLSEPPPPTPWDRRNVTTDGKTTTVVRRSSTGAN